jgi:hypothetical protein
MSDESKEQKASELGRAIGKAAAGIAPGASVDAAIDADRRMQELRESPGPWHADEWKTVRDAGGSIVADIYGDPARAALIADAWQLPQLREENRTMLELLREVMDVEGDEARHAIYGELRDRIKALLDKHKEKP